MKTMTMDELKLAAGQKLKAVHDTINIMADELEACKAENKRLNFELERITRLMSDIKKEDKRKPKNDSRAGLLEELMRGFLRP